MTVSELHNSFKFGLDKLDGLNYPNFLPEEIDLLLNQAQDSFIKQRYGLNNFKRESFEETQKRTEDLKTLIKPASLAPNASSFNNIRPNSVFITLPDDYLIVIQENVIVTFNNSSCNSPIVIKIDGQSPQTIQGKFLRVEPIQHLDFDKSIDDAFKGPDEDKVLRLFSENKIELIPNLDYTIINYRLRYIRKPAIISLGNNITSELPIWNHQELLNIAIQIALEGIEAKRNNTFTPIVVNNEE